MDTHGQKRIRVSIVKYLVFLFCKMSVIYVQMTYVKLHRLMPKKYGSTGGEAKFCCDIWRRQEIS